MTPVTSASFTGLCRHLTPGWSLVAQSRPGSCAHNTSITVYHREPHLYDVLIEEDEAQPCGAWGLSDLPHRNPLGEIVIGERVRVVIDPLIIGTMSIRPVMHPHNDLVWRDMTAQERLESGWPDMEAGNVTLRVRLDDGSEARYEQEGTVRTVNWTTVEGASYDITPYYQAPRDRIVDVEVIPRPELVRCSPLCSSGPTRGLAPSTWERCSG